MGEHTPESGEQQPETQQQRGERLARELLERHVPEPEGQDELFDATPYDADAQGQAEAAETIAGIDARNAEAVRERDEQRAADKAAKPIPGPSEERIKQRSEDILERVRRDNEEVKEGVSAARRAETSEFLVSTEASVAGAERIDAAQQAVEAAAAQPGVAEAAETKAAAMAAAHVGADRVRQVLEAISDDRDQSSLDRAYQRVRVAEVRMQQKLEAIDARIVKAKLESTSGEAPASLRATYSDIRRKHDALLRKGEALKELIEKTNRPVTEAQDINPSPESSEYPDDPS